MTEHRYPCQAPAPELVGWSNQDLAVSGHRHACIHDQLDRPKHPVVEHRCECSMTWTERVEMPEPFQIQMTTVKEGKGVLPALVAVIALALAASWLVVYL